MGIPFNNLELKILYVEDDKETRLGIVEMLGELKLEKGRINCLLIATNGREGLDLYREHKPEIIITDIWMPVMNGIDMIQEIRQSGERPYVIITSAYSDIEYFLSAIELGIERYLLKPFQFNDLVFTLEKAVEEYSIRRTLEATQEKLQKLTMELIMKEEKDRKLIAVNLHDSIGQGLVLLQMRLDRLKTHSEGQAAWDEVTGMVNKLITDTRNLTVELSPPVLHEMGLAAALESTVDDFHKKHQMDVRLILDNKLKRLNNKIEVFFYRTARELIMNALKHSGERNVNVILNQEDGFLKLEVSDLGQGFNCNQRYWNSNSFGLFSIEQRAQALGGQMLVESQPTRGTKIIVTIPDLNYNQ